MSDTHAHTVTYVRETMLPQSAPPLPQAVPLQWPWLVSPLRRWQLLQFLLQAPV